VTKITARRYEMQMHNAHMVALYVENGECRTPQYRPVERKMAAGMLRAFRHQGYRVWAQYTHKSVEF